MKKIGITGCIGSGKSTVTKVFASLGVPIYDADTRAKTLMVTSPTLIQHIKNIFGNDAYLPSGKLNSKLISDKVFTDKNSLSKLNALVHPAVFLDFEQWCESQQSVYVIKEAALMFESDSYKQLDEVIVVTAPEELRIQRTLLRDGITRDAVINRMKNQLSEEEKVKRGKYILKNDESDLLIPQILMLNASFNLFE